MAKSNQRGSKNNNPEGHNQYSGGWMDTAKERPMATAAAAAAAVGASVFLWSRRNQISEQISNLSGQITDWADEMRSGNSWGSSERDMAMTAGPNESSAMESSRASGSRSGSSRSGSPSSSTSSKSRGTTARATGGQSSTAGQNMSTGSGSTLGQ